MNDDLSHIQNWSERNFLLLNPTKSKAIYISRNNIVTSGWDNLSLYGQQIERVKTVKNLGVWFDERLNWSTHVNKLCGKLYGSVRRLWKVAWLIPIDTRIRLVKTLLLPLISYGSPVYSTVNCSILKPLEKAFNACVRFAMGLSRRDRTGVHVKTILGCTLRKYLDLEICVAINKLVSCQKPLNLASKLKASRSIRTMKLIPIKNKFKTYNGMFFIRGVKLWNELPLALRKNTTVKTFRQKCTQHYCNH